MLKRGTLHIELHSQEECHSFLSKAAMWEWHSFFSKTKCISGTLLITLNSLFFVLFITFWRDRNFSWSRGGPEGWFLGLDHMYWLTLKVDFRGEPYKKVIKEWAFFFERALKECTLIENRVWKWEHTHFFAKEWELSGTLKNWERLTIHCSFT